MPSIEPPPITDDQSTNRRQWALAHLDYAAGELTRQRGRVDYFMQRARDYGCTTAEIREVLAANQ